MKDYLVGKFLINDRLALLDEKKRLYNKTIDNAEIIERQMRRFNTVWEHCHKTIPFYKQWRVKYDLPVRISSVRDLDRFPVLTKRVIQDHQGIIFQNGGIRHHRSTGGSTGEPTRFPFSSRELAPTYADMYVGRSWYGIRPLDHMLLFWGHAHLFGTGVRGTLNNYRRKVYDYVLTIRRLSAYDMTTDTIARYVDVYRRDDKVRVIVGYTSCIYKLAKYMYENDLRLGKKDGLKAVIATSETVTKADIELLGEVFYVPVAIEYGMAETGVVAYSRETPWNIRILWDSFIMTVGRDKVMRITTLYDKLFPLINYDSGDIAEIGEEVDGSVLQVASIVGRKREILGIGTIEGGFVEVSGILIVHILKAYPHIFSIQSEQIAPNRVRVLLVADRALDLGHVKAYFLKEIRRDHETIDGHCVELNQVDSMAKTIAGKEYVVVPRGEV
jgi:phenylacetate-coenzyme A ligase PaaK-like adenylate-forming protein